MTNVKYKNIAREEAEDAELERLETEYKKQFSEKPEEQKEKTQEQLDKEKEVETWKKRYSDLQSYTAKKENETIKNLKDEVANLRKSLSDTEKKTQGIDLPETIEEARDWSEKYPDLWRVLRQLMREEFRDVEASVSAIKEEVEKDKNDIAKTRAIAAVSKVHEDFEDLIGSDEFVQWLQSQPQKRGAFGESLLHVMSTLDVQGAIEVVSLFKADKKPKKTKRDEDLEAIRTIHPSRTKAPESSGKPTFYESQVESMHVRDYERLEDTIEEARREGRFVYDLSGAAR